MDTKQIGRKHPAFATLAAVAAGALLVAGTMAAAPTAFPAPLTDTQSASMMSAQHGVCGHLARGARMLTQN